MIVRCGWSGMLTLSCLDAISQQVHTDVFTTLLVFLSSTNREIVKSALGYVKLSIHTLPVDLLRPHLDQLVPALLAWSHDHKNHFKVKVQHIFERMIRRFGWDNVYSAAGQEEAGKVLVNIKKRKDRAKRKKARGEEADGGGVEKVCRSGRGVFFWNVLMGEKEVPSGKVMTGDAFEDVLYGSESEYEGTDDDEGDARSVAPKNKAGSYGVRLRADDDEPMDLLRGAASRMTSERPPVPTLFHLYLTHYLVGRANHRRRPGKEAGRFKVDSESGKVVIPAEESGSDIEASAQRAVKDVGGGAYKESITSVDGFRRNTRGTVKFNKDTKKRRRENEDEDVEMADETEAQTRKQKQRQTVAKVGKEFMAKVRLEVSFPVPLLTVTREVVAMSGKEGWNLMRTCRWDKSRKRRTVSRSRGSDSIHESIHPTTSRTMTGRGEPRRVQWPMTWAVPKI